MIYLTRDGELFGGATADDAVADLRKKTRWDTGGVDLDDATWRKVVAERARVQTGEAVGWMHSDLFLEDLEAAGLIARPVRH